ncbi:MAG TPA: MFS transporter [Candidatus Binataceae bacterium]|nr:MFS transporter [Candidatus Binataceae bacterium]
MARVVHDPRHDRGCSGARHHDASVPHGRATGVFRLGIFFGVTLSVLYGLLVLNIKERPDFAARESNPLVPGVRRALRNRPFGILLGTYLVGSIAGAIPATMMPFFNAYVIRPKNPTFWLSMLLLGYFALGFMLLPMWVAVARRVGKRNAYLASFLLGISCGGAMFLLGPGDAWWLLGLICWDGIGFGAGLFLSPSMQAGVIDYDELYIGKRREAQYTAFCRCSPSASRFPAPPFPLRCLPHSATYPTPCRRRGSSWRSRRSSPWPRRFIDSRNGLCVQHHYSQPGRERKAPAADTRSPAWTLDGRGGTPYPARRPGAKYRAAGDLFQAIRRRIAPMGGVELDVPEREPMRELPRFEE